MTSPADEGIAAARRDVAAARTSPADEGITPDTYVSLTTPDEAVLHYGPFVEGDLAFSLTVEAMKKYGEVAILRNPSVQVLADLGIAKMTDATNTTTRDDLAPGGDYTPSNRTHPIARAMIMRQLGEYAFFWYRPEDGHFYWGEAACGWACAPSWADGTPDMDNLGYVDDMIFDTPEQRAELVAWLQEKAEWMLKGSHLLRERLEQEGA